MSTTCPENSDFTPGCSIKVVCSWCNKLMGLKTCAQSQHGMVSHGICEDCAAKYFPARILKKSILMEIGA
jgi:hypothetical protein